MTLDQASAFDPQHYTLHSDLAKLCLPSASRDANRKLAWANSVCFLFVTIGVIGFRAPELTLKSPEPPVEVVPVVFTPPVEPPKTKPEPQPDEPEKPQESSVETPQIATVVAADPAAAAFAVPVEGPVVFAPARFASAPPATPPKPTAPPKPTLFNARGRGGGTYPDPPYPSLALRRHNEGKVLLYVIVDPDGSPASVQVKDSSGYALLDTHSADWVKNKWRWPSGETRHYFVPIEYQIR